MAATHDEDPARLVGRFIANRYRVQALAGAGDRGAVYEVEDVQRGAPAALKVVLPGSSPDVVARFAREGKAIELMAHRNIVEIVDVGRDGDTLFIVSELVRGVSLRALLDEGPVPPRRALAILRQVLEALGHAHGVGVVHRDVEPANILLVDGGDPEREADLVKIIDFGVAKLVGDTLAVVGEAALTQTGMGGLGAPTYAAPETVLARAVDARVDLYSVGVIAFELLAGTLPFADPDPIALVRKHAKDPPPTLAAAAPDRTFTPQLELLVAEALAKRPDHRFRSASEMIAALDAAVMSLEALDEEVASPPPARATSLVTSTILGLPALPHVAPAAPAPPPVTASAPVAGASAGAPVAAAPAEAQARHGSSAAPASVVPAPAPAPSFAPGLAAFAPPPRQASPADAGRRQRWRIGLGAFGACALIAIIAAVATRGGGAADAPPAEASRAASASGAGPRSAARSTGEAEPSPLLGDPAGDPASRASALLARGNAAGASELLERELTGAAAGEARLHLLLGHARFALSRRVEALSAYERAITLASELGADPQVRAHAVKTLDTRDAPAAILALELLATRVTPPAREAILSQASTGRVDEVRRRARAIAEREGFADAIDRVESYGLDLKQATTCDARRVAIHKLRVEADPRAIPALARLKGKHACVEQVLADALAQLEAQR